jgi:Uma2 family endonuclease
MAQPQSGLTYDDLRRFPEDDLRRELVEGELIVTAAPSTRHQRTVVALAVALNSYAREAEGEVLVAPVDVLFTERDIVEPDVLYVRREHAQRVEQAFVRGAPDLVVEVSSPSTRRFELVRKRALYESGAVPEYWVVDLDADRVEVYTLEGGRYAAPILVERGEVVRSAVLPGFSIAVDDLLATPDAPRA